MRRRGLLGAIGAIVAVAMAPTATWAHAMPNSTVEAQIDPGEIRLVAYVPVSELKAATDDQPAGEAGAYVLAHVDILGADGRAWRKRATEASADTRDGVAVMTVGVTFTAPAGAAHHAARLRYDAVIHRIASHVVLVYRRDGAALVPLARLQAPTTELQLP